MFNLVSLKPPGHFLVLKAYMVAEIIKRKGKNNPIMKFWSTPEKKYKFGPKYLKYS